MARKRHFTPREVNHLIPRLEKVFVQIQDCRKRAEVLAGQRLTSPATAADVAEFQVVQAQTHFLMSIVEDNVNYIASLGGIVKDLSTGLVDFPGYVNGEPVWICWRRGETEVLFWHGLDEGYSARQYIETGQRNTFH